MDVFEEFLVTSNELVRDFTEQLALIDLQYLAGWDTEESLSKLIMEGFDKDTRDGYTHLGPHRADLKFRLAGKPAAEVLSRGQEKSLIAALHIAQAKLYKEKTENPCVFLVDDLMAELDDKNASQVVEWLNRLEGQVFVTGVSEEPLLDLWAKGQGQGVEIKLFHVKQGEINSVSTKD